MPDAIHVAIAFFYDSSCSLRWFSLHDRISKRSDITFGTFINLPQKERLMSWKHFRFLLFWSTLLTLVLGSVGYILFMVGVRETPLDPTNWLVVFVTAVLFVISMLEIRIWWKVEDRLDEINRTRNYL